MEKTQKKNVLDSVYQKKGQAGMASGQIVLLIVGVGVSVMVLIFVGTLGGQTYNLTQEDIDGISGTVVNETFTGDTTVPARLAHGAIDSSTLVITNATGGQVAAADLSTVPSKGTVKVLTATLEDVKLNASYTYGTAAVETNVKASITSGFEALEQTGNYLPIIVLAVVISLVLVLVLSFTSLGSGGSGTAL